MIDELQATPASQTQKRRLAPRTLGISGTLLLVALLLLAIASRIGRQREARAATEESPINHPVVAVIHPQRGETSSELSLPGNVEALYSAAIYARTDGYLQRRTVDIGGRIKSGQLLALVSSPEVDQQLLQAKATLAQSAAALEQATAALQQAKANQELARLTKERDIPLGQQHAISQQVVDEATQAYQARTADVAAANANILAAQATQSANRANVARLEQLQGFERIVAPFEGVITERNVEQGDLVSTGSAGKPLFRISQSNVLRIQIDVPQSQAVNIAQGQTAAVTVKERLGRNYVGKVVRSANALDSAARTMRTEVQVDNGDGSLLPGMYAQVRFTFPQPHTNFVIPTSSLIIDQSGTRIAAVEPNHSIHFVPVVLGNDLGIQIEVMSGISSNDLLVSNPSDLLREGQQVQIAN